MTASEQSSNLRVFASSCHETTCQVRTDASFVFSRCSRPRRQQGRGVHSTVDQSAIRGSSSVLPADSVFDPVGAASHCWREFGRKPYRKKEPRILLRKPLPCCLLGLERLLLLCLLGGDVQRSRGNLHGRGGAGRKSGAPQKPRPPEPHPVARVFVARGGPAGHLGLPVRYAALASWWARSTRTAMSHMKPSISRPTAVIALFLFLPRMASRM